MNVDYTGIVLLGVKKEKKKKAAINVINQKTSLI